MKYAYAFTKLYIASLFGGVCMRYALPAEVDIPSSLVSFVYNALTTQTISTTAGSFNLNDYVLGLMIIPILVGPLIYAFVIGKWGLLTFIVGFFAGYYLFYFVMTFSLLVLLCALTLLLLGVIVTVYARTR